MPLTIPQGQTGTLTFAPDRVGLELGQIASVVWAAQGSQEHVRFTPPDQVEGITPGVASYKVTATLSTPGEKVSWLFDVECVPADGLPPEKVLPVVIFIPLVPPSAQSRQPAS
jgi:hypothetical protein